MLGFGLGVVSKDDVWISFGAREQVDSNGSRRSLLVYPAGGNGHVRRMSDDNLGNNAVEVHGY